MILKIIKFGNLYLLPSRQNYVVHVVAKSLSNVALKSSYNCIGNVRCRCKNDVIATSHYDTLIRRWTKVVFIRATLDNEVAMTLQRRLCVYWIKTFLYTTITSLICISPFFVFSLLFSWYVNKRGVNMKCLSFNDLIVWPRFVRIPSFTISLRYFLLITSNPSAYILKQAKKSILE